LGDLAVNHDCQAGNVNKITDFTEAEVVDFTVILKQFDNQYDNLLNLFPYSSEFASINRWSCIQMAFSHAFYPPLLRSATVKKFMVGYEMMGESQDIHRRKC
jgi:UDPglucose--hexose-1-phosphate uridylyltransferase